MMSIEHRVLASMQAGVAGNFALGISTICPAIEATAKKDTGQSKLGRSGYIRFLRDRYDFFGPFIGTGLDFQNTKFSHLKILDDRNRLVPDPDLADIVYHVFRCGSAHGDDPNPRFELTTNNTPGLVEWIVNLETPGLHIPQQLLWGLIALVVFSRCNNDLVTTTDLRLEWYRPTEQGQITYQFPIDVFWGAEQTVRNFFEKLNLPKVKLDLGSTNA